MTRKIFTLSDTTKNNIVRNLRLSSFDDILEMDAVSLDVHIEKNIGKKLRLSTVIGRLIGRGSLYTFFNRLLTREWIDREIERIEK